ncbi:hypothetical protein GGR56DRAFT_613924 [Xylariaceae sp. FL0804]|nr:hypothetical protein GGR56DRAFT_613924 [Xylariaceae sp. FL0804]
MADPLLTSLCTICHMQMPKYKCPRCGARTCSLACVKKHKNWSSCNGERDATVFVPREKLKTEAGIDHDYNFLTKIERTVERTQKILRDEKEILPQDDVELPPNKRARLHKGQSRGKVTTNPSTRKWDRNSFTRLRRLGIHVSSVSYGMSRSKENKTSWNRRTESINWQVEWLCYDIDHTSRDCASVKPTRILHKILDEKPLSIGFAEAQEYHRHQQLTDRERAEEKETRKKQPRFRSSGQDVMSTAWHVQPHPLQSPSSATWSEEHGQCQRSHEYRFFFLKPRTPSKEPHRLIPLNSGQPLASLLPGLDVVEFPTICVLPANTEDIPNGLVVEVVPSTVTKMERNKASLVDYDANPASEDEEQDREEEGEVAGRDLADGGSSNDPTSSSGTSSSGSDSDMSE